MDTEEIGTGEKPPPLFSRTLYITFNCLCLITNLVWGIFL